jgi:hypothetical protein
MKRRATVPCNARATVCNGGAATPPLYPPVRGTHAGPLHARLHADAPPDETLSTTSRQRDVGSKTEAPERAVLRAHLAVLEEQVAVLKAALGEMPGRRFSIDRLVRPGVIAKKLGRTEETVRGWCKPPLHLGVEIAGSWYVDLGRLDEHINRIATP